MGRADEIAPSRVIRVRGLHCAYFVLVLSRYQGEKLRRKKASHHIRQAGLLGLSSSAPSLPDNIEIEN